MRGDFSLKASKNQLFKKMELLQNLFKIIILIQLKESLRGLHYQKNPKAQAKLVTAIRGEIFDVSVDIRKNSSTYRKWVGEILSEQNHKSLYVPEGFAHGFCVLSEEADVVYKVNEEYSGENDRGMLWNDPSVGVKWPIENPLISEKDKQQPLLDKADNNFV